MREFCTIPCEKFNFVIARMKLCGKVRPDTQFGAISWETCQGAPPAPGHTCCSLTRCDEDTPTCPYADCALAGHAGCGSEPVTRDSHVRRMRTGRNRSAIG